MAVKRGAEYSVQNVKAGWRIPANSFTQQKSQDITMYVRLMQVDGLMYVDFRDFLKSHDSFGKGYWFPYDKKKLVELATFLMTAAEDPDFFFEDD